MAFCRLSRAEEIRGLSVASVSSLAPLEIERFACRWTCFFVCVVEIVDFFAGRDFRERVLFFCCRSLSFEATNSSSVIFNLTLLLRREPRERLTGVFGADDWRSRSDNTLLRMLRTAAIGVVAQPFCRATRQVLCWMRMIGREDDVTWID
jgi:hypothetical protein